MQWHLTAAVSQQLPLAILLSGWADCIAMLACAAFASVGATPPFASSHRTPRSTRHQKRASRQRVQAVAAPQSSAMRVYQAAAMDASQLAKVTARPRIDFTSILGTVSLCGCSLPPPPAPRAYIKTPCRVQVAPIVEDVRSRGDDAVKEYTAKFDRVQLDTVCVPIEVRAAAECRWL